MLARMVRGAAHDTLTSMVASQTSPVASSPVVCAPAVADAIAAGRPVVALESTIIAHGLPRPANLEAARGFEQLLRDQQVTPATVAVLDGRVRIGLTDDELERVACSDIVKASVRDLPVLLGTGRSGATTVSATAFLASRAGLRVFATGGLGGVHRFATSTFDESADLVTLAGTPLTVVCAGVKSILDIAATLERLETLGITVLGYRTARLDNAAEVADVMAAADGLGRREAIVVANPLAADAELDRALHDDALAGALADADARGLRGKQVSPFLLAAMVEATSGRSLEVNLALVRSNVALAGEVALAWAAHDGAGSSPPRKVAQ
jgi:pseudouridine-5'-phosphate glycosidase